jgi:hypothetical protein
VLLLSSYFLIMPPKKRVNSSPAAPKPRPKKRARVAAPTGSSSQPIPIAETQQSPSLPPAEALPNAPKASQATSTFESQLRNACPKVEITAATEGSEEATVASSHTADEPFDGDFEDNYDAKDWSRLPRFMKPPTTSRRAPSWIYQHGYRVVLRSDMETVYFICKFCHTHKFIDAGISGVYPSAATTASARHLEDTRSGHGFLRPGKQR